MKRTAFVIALLSVACAGGDDGTTGSTSPAGGAGSSGSSGATASGSGTAGASGGGGGTTAADATLCLDACTAYRGCADTFVDGPAFDMSKCTARCALEVSGAAMWQPVFARHFYARAAALGPDTGCALKDPAGYGWGGWTEVGLPFVGDSAYASCRKVADVSCMPDSEDARRKSCVRTAYAASDPFRPKFAECDTTFGDCGDWQACYLKVLVTQGQGEGFAPWTGQQ